MANDTKTVTSEKWELIPLEKRKLFKSGLYAVLAVVALVVVNYLEQFGLPEQFKFLAPFLPVIINTLQKWAGENTYIVKK